MGRLSERTIAVVSAALASGLWFLGLGRPSLWYDEAASISAASRPLGDLPPLLEHKDLVHGLYYLVLHVWVGVFGTSAVAVRSLSVVALGVAAAGFATVAHRLGGSAVALAGGLTFAVLPGLAWAATEAREWTMATAAVVWATVALLAAVDTGGWRRWAAYTVLSIAAIGLSVMTALMALPHLWLAWRSRRARPALGAVAVAATVTSPLLVAAFAQRDQLDWIDLTVREAFARVVVNQLFLAQHSHHHHVAWALGPALALLFAGFALLGLIAGKRGAWFGAVWVLAPTAVLVVPVLAGIQLYQERYLTFAAPGACLLFAEGLVEAVRRTRGRQVWRALMAATLVGATVATAFAVVMQRQPTSKSDDDYRGLASLARGADQVFFGRADARGIKIAYPGPFAGVDDVLLETEAGPSGTLWGVDRRLRSVPPRGEVVVYVFTRPRRPSDASFVPSLHDRGCVETDRLRRPRWTGRRFTCPDGFPDHLTSRGG